LFVSVLARGRALASSLRREAKQSSRKRRIGLLRRFAPRNDAGSKKLARAKTAPRERGFIHSSLPGLTRQSMQLGRFPQFIASASGTSAWTNGSSPVVTK